MSSPQEEMIEVLYNTCYGGYNLSNKAIKLFNEKSDTVKLYYDDTSDEDCKDTSDEDCKEHEKCDEKVFSITIERHNPLLISIFKKLGKKCNGSCAKLAIRTIPKKYEKYYEIAEYDGKENVIINTDKYLLGEIKTIISNTEKTNDEKINDLQNLLL